jgi:hypothetical protein
LKNDFAEFASRSFWRMLHKKQTRLLVSLASAKVHFGVVSVYRVSFDHHRTMLLPGTEFAVLLSS